MVLATLLFVYSQLDLPETPPPLQTTFVYDRDGRQIATLHAAVNRTIIPFEDMDASIRDAVIATEDRNFYSNPGFDPIGILRAAWTDLIAHDAVQGASTITQQLVKNVYAGRYVRDPETGVKIYETPPRTIGQKVREVLLAVKLNQRYTKDEILAKYLNTIYFGHGAYGVQAAAQTYFDKDASQLTALESATLAGLIREPSSYDPGDPDNYDIALGRRNYVLDRMVEEGYLGAERADELRVRPLRTPGLDLAAETRQFPAKLGYFLDYVRRTASDEFGDANVFGGGLRITTTLDSDMQHAAEQAVAAQLPDPNGPDAAVVAIDPSNGAVRAMYGGRNFHRNQVNLALTGAKGYGGSGRHAGSAFKVFTLVTALEQRMSLNSRWNGPSTITISDPACYTKGEPWTLSNASDSESGTFTLLSATAHSVNTVFAQVASHVGPENIVDVAHRMGIRSHLDPVCSITLGTQEINALEMTNAYATLAANGTRRWASPITRVESATGEVEFERKGRRGEQVIERNDALLATYALEGVIDGGTGYRAQIGRPAAGKTGTAQEYKDAWFCGYTPQLAACVWVGYREGEIPLENVGPWPAVYGGTIPALIWHDFMVEATEGMEIRDFDPPSFEGYTGQAPTPPPAPEPTEEPTTSPEPTESPEPTRSPEPTKSPEPSPSSPPPTPSPTPTTGFALRRRGPSG